MVFPSIIFLTFNSIFLIIQFESERKTLTGKYCEIICGKTNLLQNNCKNLFDVPRVYYYIEVSVNDAHPFSKVIIKLYIFYNIVLNNFKF